MGRYHFFGLGTDPISLFILFLLGDPLQKTQDSVVSNRIGVEFRRVVLQVKTHRLTESDF